MSRIQTRQTMFLAPTPLNKLKGKKNIEKLFSEGQKITLHPLSIVVLTSEEMALGVSVGKRHFKQAVDRNKIKRHLRNVLRKQLLSVFEKNEKNFSVMLIYIGSQMPTLAMLEKKAIKLEEKINKTL